MKGEREIACPFVRKMGETERHTTGRASGQRSATVGSAEPE